MVNTTEQEGERDWIGPMFTRIDLNETVPSLLTTDERLILKAQEMCKRLGVSSVWFTHRSEDFGYCVVTFDMKAPVNTGGRVHRAEDIPGEAGEPVIAQHDGVVISTDPPVYGDGVVRKGLEAEAEKYREAIRKVKEDGGGSDSGPVE